MIEFDYCQSKCEARDVIYIHTELVIVLTENDRSASLAFFELMGCRR